MYVPTINDFEKLTDNEAQAYIGQVIVAYNQARMSRFVRAYCNQNRLSRFTYDNMMAMSNVQPRFQNTCKAVVKNTGAVCTRCALPEYGGLFCGYHKKQYDRHKREQDNNHKKQVTKKNNKGKKLEI
jgi:hypothetical protein